MGADDPKRAAVVMSWSGGKDSALALHELRADPRYEVVALMTSVSEEFRRVSHHGVREELLEAQAEAIGVPLTKIYLPSGETTPCTNAVYEEIMGRVMEDFKSQGVYTVGFGDLFLEDLRAWRERNMAKAGMSGVFPIWKWDTHQLSRQIIAMGFKAILSCVEGLAFSRSCMPASWPPRGSGSSSKIGVRCGRWAQPRWLDRFCFLW